MLVFKTYLVTSYEALDFTWTVSFGNLKYKNSPTCLGRGADNQNGNLGWYLP